MLRDPSLQAKFADIENLSEEVIVLICGHGGRDKRCGAMGPLLKVTFEDLLGKKGYDVRLDGTPLEPGEGKMPKARVGLISHIGGHKFAGNVIIYMPSKGNGELIAEKRDSLLGKEIWYGRVEPRHVEGLIEETIMKGRVVEELCRGVVGRDGELYRP
jgi:hypothetical protein